MSEIALRRMLLGKSLLLRPVTYFNKLAYLKEKTYLRDDMFATALLPLLPRSTR